MTRKDIGHFIARYERYWISDLCLLAATSVYLPLSLLGLSWVLHAVLALISAGVVYGVLRLVVRGALAATNVKPYERYIPAKPKRRSFWELARALDHYVDHHRRETNNIVISFSFVSLLLLDTLFLHVVDMAWYKSIPIFVGSVFVLSMLVFAGMSYLFMEAYLRKEKS